MLGSLAKNRRVHPALLGADAWPTASAPQRLRGYGPPVPPPKNPHTLGPVVRDVYAILNEGVRGQSTHGTTITRFQTTPHVGQKKEKGQNIMDNEILLSIFKEHNDKLRVGAPTIDREDCVTLSVALSMTVEMWITHPHMYEENMALEVITPYIRSAYGIGLDRGRQENVPSN